MFYKENNGCFIRFVVAVWFKYLFITTKQGIRSISLEVVEEGFKEQLCESPVSTTAINKLSAKFKWFTSIKFRANMRCAKFMRIFAPCSKKMHASFGNK
ncbi:hypothetical protein [Adhaeribacter rhizoryzae]|uniref:hypothetical protein n=1 Tax=Adhaeribacter rhizoryzae TaxID=2607907 RepID=UPI0012329DF0|nr:hypothetical protein [Adhaeribacter rhizoryzae]